MKITSTKTVVSVLLLMCITLLFAGCGTEKQASADTQSSQVTQSGEITVTQDEESTENSYDYTTDEFNTLSGTEQTEVQNTFENTDSSDKEAESKETTLPSDKEEVKQTSLPLSGEKQTELHKDSESTDSFDKSNENKETTLHLDNEAVKQTTDYISDDFDNKLQQESENKETTLPWNKEGAKQPSDYTLDEFNALSGAEQIKFQQEFESYNEFNEWLQKAQNKTVLPWDKEGAKQPSDYTLDEFNALSGAEQIKFQQEFENSDEFNEWLQDAGSNNATVPWDEEGAKQPSDYTLDEFNNLSDDEQIKFQNDFKTPDDFDNWLQEAESKETTLPWDKEGAKQPSDYTLDEFDALSGDEQMKFQKEFETPDDFDEWLQEAENSKETSLQDTTSKQPSDYTWEEFNALSGDEQIKFQQEFESYEKFNEWLQKAENKESTLPWDKEGAKQPSDYTWEEFQALSGEEQIMFQRSFDSIDEFDKWLTANKD